VTFPFVSGNRPTIKLTGLSGIMKYIRIASIRGMASSKEQTSEQSVTAPEFYTWTFPGAPVQIQLHLSMIERLAPEVRRASEAVPEHGVEIGGLLLGTADFQVSPIVEIKDFVPFRTEYRADHKFIVSETDQRKLETTLADRRSEREDGLSVVGYYRSHIGAGLGLNEHDLALAEKHFYDPADVFLLVKPSADSSSTAGFFFWDNGHIDSEFTFLEFPFDARLLSGVRVKPSIPDITPELAELEAPGELQQFETPEIGEIDLVTPVQETIARPAMPWLWYPLFTLLMIVLGAVGYKALLQWTASAPVSTPAASDVPALSLRVERKDNDLRVSWSRQAPAVTQAKDASLSIRDGDTQQQELQLTLDQLRTGSVLYTPANNSVQFRLEVTAPDNTKTSETVLALTAAKNDAIKSAAVAPAKFARPAPAGEPPGSPNRKAFTPPTSERNFGEPVRVAMVDPPSQQPNVPAPSQSLVRDLIAPALQKPVIPAQPASTQPAAAPPSSPPPAPSAPPFLAARPIRESQPVLSGSVRGLIVSQVEVDIKIRINESGRVVKAEPLPSKALVSSSLIGAARSAAMLWRFEPARRGNQPVASDLVLRFQYRPAAPH
jgi:hypothetical protein